MIPGRLQQWNTTKSRDLDRVFGVPRGMQGNGGLHGVVSDTCEHRTDGMQGRSENVAHARAVDGLRLRRAPQSQLDLYAPSNPLFRSEQSEPLQELHGVLDEERARGHQRGSTCCWSLHTPPSARDSDGRSLTLTQVSEPA